MRELDRRTSIRAIGATLLLPSAATLTAAQDDDDEPDYGDWFDDVDDFEETVDETGEEEVTVAVGTGDQGFMFDPAAVRVSEGATVVWEWTGQGGAHNVVHDVGAEVDESLRDLDEDEVEEEDPAFESELVDEEGHVFEHEFDGDEDEEGAETDDGEIFLYVCTPHRALGMKGAVVVEEDDELTDDENGDDGNDDEN